MALSFSSVAENDLADINSEITKHHDAAVRLARTLSSTLLPPVGFGSVRTLDRGPALGDRISSSLL